MVPLPLTREALASKETLIKILAKWVDGRFHRTSRQKTLFIFTYSIFNRYVSVFVKTSLVKGRGTALCAVEGFKTHQAKYNPKASVFVKTSLVKGRGTAPRAVEGFKNHKANRNRPVRWWDSKPLFSFGGFSKRKASRLPLTDGSPVL